MTETIRPMVYSFARPGEMAWRAVSRLAPAADRSEEVLTVPKPCPCGQCLGEIFASWKYGGQRGPGYRGRLGLEDFAGWEQLTSEVALTGDERRIIVAMSPNEGNIDSVQSYDSEILTAGAMQKTINPNGYGEFPAQVAAFKDKYPERYRRLFENCGWKVEREDKGWRMYYRDETGPKLKSTIRSGFEVPFSGRKSSAPLNPIVHAIASPEFQALQVSDFVKRLRLVSGLMVSDGLRLDDYFASQLGRALALDHHINRPAYVVPDLRTALTRLLEKSANPGRDPRKWSNHPEAEAALIELYAPARRMTDAGARYRKLKDRLQ
ncbi:hypothetical protein [Novilysobacter luteus]|uniref:Uncharacterized protein n=1 Tax=Novilysobacter luteus TaxID=2822368 RepID=A0ABN7QY90_9GAMM|nr:hypothetical protein [Lysobacter luteus]CAG4976558.1 hypothetical protein LYB30171_02215 [Lysobacter luteus]